MNYYSTNRKSPVVDFKTATINGQPPDKGLYFPEHIPTLPADFFSNLEKYSNEELGFKILQPYIGNNIPGAVLEDIIRESINFSFPLRQISRDIYVLELFHGPTLAFKDVGARFISRCLGYFARSSSEQMNILVATSGDTGEAVANAFYEVNGVQVIILYPSGKVSPLQEQQIASLGKNIHALEVAGNFDDCQRMVKDAFADVELNRKINLTSANSINIARWLPQQLYYFFALKQWHAEAPVISVPSGNFGNICAGLLAHSSGLPVQHFIAACNANDVVPQFLKTGSYEPHPAKATISNAMDVGDPSNIRRVTEIFDHDIDLLKALITATSITDNRTLETISIIYRDSGYLMDTHTAVAYTALRDYLHGTSGKGIVLSTAHPVKFAEVIEPAIGIKIPSPSTIDLKRDLLSIPISPVYDELKSILLSLN